MALHINIILSEEYYHTLLDTFNSEDGGDMFLRNVG
jgi:hypothetical protein